jgi:hypothetical protein
VAVQCFELTGVRSTADAKNPAGQADYIVVGTLDRNEAEAAVFATAPLLATITVPVGAGYVTGDLVRLSVETTELGGGVWKATVNFGVADSVPGAVTSPPSSPPPPPPPSEQDVNAALGREISFSTAGGTTHITKSLLTRFKHELLPNGVVVTDGAPDQKGAIGVSRDRVNGCDVYAPKLEWSISVRRPTVTHAYLMTVAELTGRLNQEPFFGRPTQHLLYLGATGQFRAGEGWHVTHSFAEGKVPKPFKIGPWSIDDDVYPFDVIWETYWDKEDKGYPATQPRFIYCERVYELHQLKRLEI